MRAISAPRDRADHFVKHLLADGWELLPDYCTQDGTHVRLVFGSRSITAPAALARYTGQTVRP